MLTSFSGRCIGSFAMVCVLLLFFFPLVHGPFQATHGPTTAFRARRSFQAVALSIVDAARALLGPFKHAAPVFSEMRSCLLPSLNEFDPALDEDAVLRC